MPLVQVLYGLGRISHILPMQLWVSFLASCRDASSRWTAVESTKSKIWHHTMGDPALHLSLEIAQSQNAVCSATVLSSRKTDFHNSINVHTSLLQARIWAKLPSSAAWMSLVTVLLLSARITKAQPVYVMTSTTHAVENALLTALLLARPLNSVLRPCE